MALIDKIYTLATSAVVVSSGSAFVAYASTLGNGGVVATSSTEEIKKSAPYEHKTNSYWDFQDWPIGSGDGKSDLEWL